jgi:hypothetical protein
MKWRIYKSSSNYAELKPRPLFGESSDVPVPADYDGDGLADIAVVKTNLKVSVTESSTGAVWSSGYPLVLPDPAWKPGPGDYNGDGKVDVAWFRPGSETWRILVSDADNSDGNTNPAQIVVTTTIGTSNDYPIIAQQPTYMGGNTIDVIGDPVVIGAGAAGVKPSIAVDSADQPHAVVLKWDGGGVWDLYDKVGGTWQSSTTVSLSDYWSPAGSWNNPHMEIDLANDRCWISGIMVIIGNYDGTGIGMITRANMTSGGGTAEFQRRQMVSPPSWATGNSAVDQENGSAVIWVNYGVWEKLIYSGGISKVDSGSTLFPGINLGERPTDTFRISRAGAVVHPVSGTHSVWHAAFGGHPGLEGVGLRRNGYQNSFNLESGGGKIDWVDSAIYGGGEDHDFTGLTTDNSDPLVAYMAIDTHMGLGIVANVWDGSTMVHSITTPFSTPGSSGFHRWSPQLAPAVTTGAWMCYVDSGVVKLIYLSVDGADDGTPVTVASSGAHASIAVDSVGYIHLVYMNGGNVCYKLITTK